MWDKCTKMKSSMNASGSGFKKTQMMMNINMYWGFKQQREAWHTRSLRIQSSWLVGISWVSRAEDTVSSAALCLFAAQVEQCHPCTDSYITRVRNLELNTVLPSSLIQKFIHVFIAFLCESTLQWFAHFISRNWKRFLRGQRCNCWPYRASSLAEEQLTGLNQVRRG